ncbi:inactive polyglycylase TTLL10, partial [Heterocephalus glaber]|uniref:Inactive polyglycylase TTLL10 n=1 Tax=Heterocephalus glaber TaxID=10181 RepID=A0AAX6RQN1_HETGA
SQGRAWALGDYGGLCRRAEGTAPLSQVGGLCPPGPLHPHQGGPSSPLADNGPWVTNDVTVDIVTPAPGDSLQPCSAQALKPGLPCKELRPCGISTYCRSKGWQRTQDSRREDYRLKWCGIKCRESYHSFREGQQLLFQLPNNKLLTTKTGLLSALREHERTLGEVTRMPLAAQARVLQMEDFFPETYRLDLSDERQAFFTLFDETQPWICKPTASNQGKGIFLIRSQEDLTALQAKIHSSEDGALHCKMSFGGPQARVVQRYIQNPLLLNGKKFNVRSYLLIACAVPYMVFFGHGYAHLTLSLYNPHSSDLSSHLTNQFMQKQSPLYMSLKEDTVWSMDHLNCYINDKFQRTKGLPQDWVFTTFTKRMQQIMAHCLLAVKSKLECKLGYFDLIGCDFLIDENFKVWLLEMNSNPALHTNCDVLKKVIPSVVMETLVEPAPSRLRTWRSKLPRRACEARRCCPCARSAASRFCTTARRTFNRACARAPRLRAPGPSLAPPPAARSRPRGSACGAESRRLPGLLAGRVSRSIKALCDKASSATSRGPGLPLRPPPSLGGRRAREVGLAPGVPGAPPHVLGLSAPGSARPLARIPSREGPLAIAPQCAGLTPPCPAQQTGPLSRPGSLSREPWCLSGTVRTEWSLEGVELPGRTLPGP